MGEPAGGFRVWRLKDSAISATYATIDEGLALLNWLHERAAGYPKLDLPWPRSLALSDREGATWPARTVRADAYDWTWGAGSSGATD